MNATRPDDLNVGKSLREPGAVLLVSCYELGHQPLAVSSPAASLRAAGFDPHVRDGAVKRLVPEDFAGAPLIAISVPMLTATRIGVQVARRAREVNPDAVIGFYGYYAWLNAEYLFDARVADFVIGGESETPLVDAATALDEGRPVDGIPGVRTPGAAGTPF
ncbi:MAG: hypothetical protein M5R36_13285 [Deltaproteobacteria bacterium]|nr:hypothetical protein [Deltaproteobacteria bacterium]